MDDFKLFRYDFFGEYLTQESNANDAVNGLLENNKNVCHEADQNQAHSNETLKNVPEDSLMEFITDYFQGDVTADFPEAQSSYQQSVKDNLQKPDEPHERMNAFDSSSSSELSTSIELFTSPETSMILANIADQSMESDDGIAKSDLLSQTENQLRQCRRKSISYDIVFTNSKDKNGKVKIHIVPNEKASLENEQSQTTGKFLPRQKKPNLNPEETFQQENTLLRQRVHDLERKLRCVEIESERVVGELSRIIERKNETISQLELQIAGVKMM